MSARPWIRFLPFAVGAGLLWASWAPAGATTLVRLSLAQLTEASSQIVRARPVGQVSYWNAAHTQVVTLTTVEVEQAIKGQAPSTMAVEQPGGAVGHFREVVPGTVNFYPNTSYVLFLQPGRPRKGTAVSHYFLVGMVQGAYRIYQDPVTHEERVIQPVGDVSSPNPNGREPTAGTTSLPQFRQTVASVLRAPPVVPAGTRLPLTIVLAESEGVGRLYVEARTTADVYPNRQLLVPAGSEIKGEGMLADGTWKILWASVAVGGRRVPVTARNELTAGESLPGMRLVAVVHAVAH